MEYETAILRRTKRAMVRAMCSVWWERQVGVNSVTPVYKNKPGSKLD